MPPHDEWAVGSRCPDFPRLKRREAAPGARGSTWCQLTYLTDRLHMADERQAISVGDPDVETVAIRYDGSDFPCSDRSL
jgi:hypothetical protein